MGTRALKTGPLGESRLPGVNEKWPPMVPALDGDRTGEGGWSEDLTQHSFDFGPVKTGCHTMSDSIRAHFVRRWLVVRYCRWESSEKVLRPGDPSSEVPRKFGTRPK